MSAEDSVLIVSSYINNWATQKLLLGQAEINLSESQLKRFDQLVREYKNDLLTEAYKNVIVSQQLDSTVSRREYEAYYEEYKENFLLKEVLVKSRFIHVHENYEGLESVERKFRRFDPEDQQELSEREYQFLGSNLNDSVWVKRDVLLEALPVLRASGTNMLKKSDYFRLQDSLGVYLVKIEGVLNINETAPLSYLLPTIKEIIINKRKLELIKKLETDITKDAIENKNFEIYKLD